MSQVYKYQAKDKARKRGGSFPWVTGKKRRAKRKAAPNVTWLGAIQSCKDGGELTQIARNIATRYKAGKMSKRQYKFLVTAGRTKRAELGTE